MIVDQTFKTDAAVRKQLITELYKKTFPAVARFVSNKGGNMQDARDVFHDALIVFYEKLQQQEIPGASHEAYLLGIARNLWFRKFNSEVSKAELDETAGFAADDLPGKEQNSILNFLERTGKRCMEMLKSFYYDKQDMEQIRERFGYGSVRSATVQKFKCLEKIREEVKERKLFYEDFA
jgi:DNA-directed RNA polymerase specialized sigma24 family protein